jgi:predicted Fe-Mo cluster-binding NifX family protein
MKLAVPIWNDRVSPVFDTAAQILVVDVDEGQVLARQTHTIKHIPGLQRGEWLIRAGVGTVVCGAVSSAQEAVLLAAGIKVIPWIGGEVDEILEAYCAGDLDRGDFHLPGFGVERRRRRRGRRPRNGRGNPGKHFRHNGR